MVGDDEVGAVWGHYRGYVDLGYVDEDADVKKKIYEARLIAVL